MLLSHAIFTPELKQDLPTGLIWAGNGIFRSVKRIEFTAIVLHHQVNTPCLPELTQDFKLLVPQVPQDQVKKIIDRVNEHATLEQLFYLYWRATSWEVIQPEQECTPSSCVSLEQYPEPAVIEIHSHGAMGAFFSSTDDREENGCRISTVIGRRNNQLEINSRVCVHGLFLNVPTDAIFENINNYCHHVIPF